MNMKWGWIRLYEYLDVLNIRCDIFAPFSQVDFSQELQVVTFRLAGDRCLYFDRRVLTGQSEYFREMLATSVWQESQTGGLMVQHGSTIFSSD